MLVAFAAALVPLAVYFVVRADRPGLMVLLGCASIFGLLALLGANAAVRPLHVLVHRLERKNKGEEQFIEEAAGPVNFSLDRGLLDMFFDGSLQKKWNASVPRVFRTVDAVDERDAAGVMPPELRKIERMAKVGRTVDLAMESVKADILHHFSHQLKTPMAIARSHTAQARSAMSQGKADDVVYHLDSIDQIAMDTSRLVEHILNLAYIDKRAADKGSRSLLLLSDAAQDVIDKLGSMAAERGMKLQIKLDEGERRMWGDETLLRELISGLVENSITYANENTRVDISVQQLQGKLRLIVADQGPGIPESERSKVFQMFYGHLGKDASGRTLFGTRRSRQIDGLPKNSHGVGLSLVQSVAKMHDAKLSLGAPAAGSGLVVTVEFPQD